MSIAGITFHQIATELFYRILLNRPINLEKKGTKLWDHTNMTYSSQVLDLIRLFRKKMWNGFVCL